MDEGVQPVLFPARTTAVGTLAAVVALVLTAPAPGTALQTLADAGPQHSPTQVVVALIALPAWALAMWSCTVVALTTGGHLPGRAGRALAAVAARTVPVTVRRTVELALGLTVAAGVLTSPASAATGATAAASASHIPATTTPAPSLDWGGQPADAGATVVRETAAAGADRQHQDPAARCAHGGPTAETPAAPGTVAAVVVRPGDTLWDLAEQHLRVGARGEPTDAQVATSWPSWWAVNREVVGDDPDLLLPGTVLQPPAAAAHPPAR